MNRPTLEKQIEILSALLALRRRGLFPPLWVDQGRLMIEAGLPLLGGRRRISWAQAELVAAGARLEDVLAGVAPRRPPVRESGVRRGQVPVPATRKGGRR